MGEMKLLPVDPSEHDGMMEAGFAALRDGEEWGRFVSPADVYRAMVRAFETHDELAVTATPPERT